MRSNYFLTVLLAASIIASCTKEPEKVTQPVYTVCNGKASFSKNSTGAKIDTLDNTFFTYDSTYQTQQRATRLDIRIIEESGNILVLTLTDLNNDSVPTPGFYSPSSLSRTGKMRYYNPNYQSSGYLADTVGITLTSFDQSSYACSGTFSGRLINPVKKDTINIRNGDFKSICVSKI
ncbi:MAG: hypothetical protein V4616_10000 [Bacteroidota bacterium]